MYNLDKKQKIILGILVAIVIGSICYYVYAKEDNSNIQLEVENGIKTEKQSETQEEYSDDRILVHVSGAVNKEGVVELKVDSRISDAIEKAGGIREDASIEDINLAYKLEDGMKVHIPTKQEKENDNNEDTDEKEENIEKYMTSSNDISNKEEKSSKVNINTATQAQLETLPGIGPSTATKIIVYRKEKGKFNKVEEIKEVSGIGESKYNKIKDFIFIK